MDADITFHDQNLPDEYWRDYNDLCRAIRNEDNSSVHRLISQGVRVNAEYQEVVSRTPLHLAVISRSPETIKLLLDRGADIGAKDWNFDTPLTLAAKMENRYIVDMLLSDDVKNQENEECFSHLHIACMMGRTDIVKKLVLDDHGENINKTVKVCSIFWPGYTPLHFATRYGFVETVKCLLNLGADMMIADSRKLTPLHLAHLQENEKIIDLLLNAHKNEFKNPVSELGLSHFHIACTRNDMSVIEHFLELGEFGLEVDDEVRGDEEVGPWHSFRPICFAIYHGWSRVIKRLIEAGAYLGYDISPCLLNYTFLEKKDEIYKLIITGRPALASGYNEHEIITSLHLACIQNDMESINSAIDEMDTSPLDLNAPIRMGLTILHIAARYNCERAVEFLLNLGADFLAQDTKGETPLHVAFRYRYDEVFQLIIKRVNSDSKNLCDSSGLSIFHLLCTTDQTTIIEKFLQDGVDINAQVNNQSAWAGFTALHFACQFQQIEVVTLLLRYGPDIRIKTEMNLSPLDLVMRNLSSKSLSEKDEAFLFLIMNVLQFSIENSGIKGISRLHAFCISPLTDLKEMQLYIQHHKNELNEISSLPVLRRYNKCTPLHFAVLSRNFAQADFLLKNGANPSIVNDEGKSPFEYMLLYDRSSDFPNRVKNYFKHEEFIQNLTPNLFYVVCVAQLSNVVKYILSEASIEKTRIIDLLNHRDDLNRTPLHSIARESKSASKTEIVHLLLENGANVHAQDCQLDTPLHAACKSNDFDVINLLLEYGSDVDAQNVYGETPLHVLFGWATVDDKHVLELLLDNGCDIEAVNECGITCLDIWTREIGVPMDDETLARVQDCIITCLKQEKKLELMKSMANKNSFCPASDACSSLKRRYLNGSWSQETIFINNCIKELELMKAVNVSQCTTLLDILCKNPDDLLSLCENVKLQKMLDTRSFLRRYPIYGSLIKSQVKKGRMRRKLFIESRKSFNNLVGVDLPQFCSESIFQYLSNEDLRNIILLGDEQRA
ncbi:hypothetical protein QAD02_009911 [Eretmocerus hayati]|uniref:Uncharacterized protein n=1 Tax=Eretmocerus hayati TaxID=131215 RepID=A0ACC2NBD2_9HYME|nr:hypothetical protein QAD02_009911 [Eretmocerus hayati]